MRRKFEELKERALQINAERELGRKTLGVLTSEKQVLGASIERCTSEIELLQQARQLCEAVRIYIMQNAHARIERITTYAVQSVIGSINEQSQNRFVIDLVARRNQFEVDFWNEGSDGGREELFSSCGGTYWDVSSTALLISIRSLLGVNSLLYLDEVGKYVSPDMAPHFGEFLRSISHEMNCQIILNSHLPSMSRFADAAFQCRLENGHSVVSRVES